MLDSDPYGATTASRLGEPLDPLDPLDGSPTAESASHPVARACGWLAIVLVLAYAVVGAVFVVVGTVNGDEGWYLYAARLVYQGKLPYRDFAFTQTPLLPYVYGAFQLVSRSLYMGRAVSLGFALAAVALCVRVAWREAGAPAAAAVGLLCVAAPSSVYWLTITKTYALVAFFLAALLALLLSPGRRSWTFPLAAAAAVGLTLSRASGLPLTVLVVAYLLWCAPDRRTRVLVGTIVGVGAVILGGLVLADLDAARFDLLSFHSLLWHGAPTHVRVDQIVTERLPAWFGEYWGYVLLIAAACVAVAVSPALRRYCRARPAYSILAAGSLLYLVLQLPPGQFSALEYPVPLVPLVVTMAVILVSRALLGPRGTAPTFRGAGVVMAFGVVALAALTAVHPSVDGFAVGRGSADSVHSADQVAEIVRAHSRPSDRVLALWEAPAVVAADRDLVPDTALGVFSYEDLATGRARALHYVNQERLVRTVESREPAVIVLSDVDRLFLSLRGALSDKPANEQRFTDALDANYRRVASTFGPGLVGRRANVDVYVRR